MNMFGLEHDLLYCRAVSHHDSNLDVDPALASLERHLHIVLDMYFV